MDLHQTGKPTMVKTSVSALVSGAKGACITPSRAFSARAPPSADRGYNGSILTERERENWMDWDDIVSRRKELEKEAESSTAAMYDHPLLTLYSVMPPMVRADPVA